jgi:hypothetical protein
MARWAILEVRDEIVLETTLEVHMVISGEKHPDCACPEDLMGCACE